MTTTKPISLLLAIATVLAIATPSLAVDIQVFDSSTACSGTGSTFAGIGAGLCISSFKSAGSVLFTDLSSCKTGNAYNGGACTKVVGSGNGPSARCFIGGGFTGAKWIDGCRRRKLQAAAEVGTPECTSHAQPNGIHYTNSEGSWILHSPKATLLLELLRAVEDAEKVEWLKAQGAHFIRN